MYNVEDAQNVMQHFTPCDYNSVYEICPGLKVRFVDAGHLLGSSSIEMWVTEENVTKKIVFSGDIGNHNRPLIKDPQYVDSADYVVMESTYGNRLHDTPPDYAVELSKVINATFTRGGNLVIPAFSVGRTQEMLYFIRRIKTENLLPEHPNFEVYIDSPLAVEATNVFHENVSDCFDEEAMELISAGINPIKFPGLRVASSPTISNNALPPMCTGICCGCFFSRFPVSYKAVAQALLPSFKSVTLYSLLLSLLRSQKHFNTMYDMTKPKHIITVASELKKLSRAVTMPPVSTVTNIHSAKSLRNGIFLPACLPIASLAANGTTTRTEVHL